MLCNGTSIKSKELTFPLKGNNTNCTVEEMQCDNVVISIPNNCRLPKYASRSGAVFTAGSMRLGSVALTHVSRNFSKHSWNFRGIF